MVVLPGVNIGNNVVIGAGSIVTRDIPDNSLAYKLNTDRIKPIIKEPTIEITKSNSQFQGSVNFLFLITIM